MLSLKLGQIEYCIQRSRSVRNIWDIHHLNELEKYVTSIVKDLVAARDNRNIQTLEAQINTKNIDMHTNIMHSIGWEYAYRCTWQYLNILAENYWTNSLIIPSPFWRLPHLDDKEKYNEDMRQMNEKYNSSLDKVI